MSLEVSEELEKYPGQPFGWYYEGRLDEYAIRAHKLALDWLATSARQTSDHVPTDAFNERAFRPRRVKYV